MAKKALFVTKHEHGWAVRSPGATRAGSVHRTQKEAEARAKKSLSESGGGEVVIQGCDGKFRDSDTVAPGNDPFPPRDKKH